MAMSPLEALRLLLGQIDYKDGACGPNEMIGACIPPEVLDRVKEAALAAPKIQDRAKMIERAGRAIKILRLVNMPGMDDVAVKLNCGLTYDEKRHAEYWAKALELAADNPDLDLFELAAKLREEAR